MKLAQSFSEINQSYALILPDDQLTPVLLDSPHSCKDYPAEFHPACTEADLLTSWDAFVDELFSAAPDLGAPLLSARFPRFFLDPNRARDDIDLELVQGQLPFATQPTDKSQKGFGLLRRYALPGVKVYAKPIPVLELLKSIENYYDPYHLRLAALIDEAAQQFGRVVHLDCHSMKSRGNAMNDDHGAPRPDIVISDIFGTTADSALTKRLATLMSEAGFQTKINDPYKGGHIIHRHSDPQRNRHSIQIEVNRVLYMDEAKFTKSDNFGAVQSKLSDVLAKFIAEV